MKIKDLIKILEKSTDKNKDLYIPSIKNERVTNIWYNFDDLGNIELYEVSKDILKIYI